MKKAALLYALIFILTAVLGLGFRLYPLLTHVKGNAEEKATLYLISKIRANINGQIIANYPQLTESQSKLLSQKLFDEYLHKNGPQVRQQIVGLSQEISASSQEGGRASPYLLASDSYYYLSLSQRILDKGAISDAIKGSKYFNELMLAPQGQWEPLNLHPFLGAFLYKFLNAIDPSIDLVHAVSFLPLIITVLSLIGFIALGIRCSLHPLAIAVASAFFLLAPIHMKRSMFAWYDNDPYNILFPLLILNLLFLTIEQAVKKKMALLTALTVAAFGLYAYFWHGWIFMLVIVLSALSVSAALALAQKNILSFRHYGLVLLSILLGCLFLIGCLFGPGALLTLFQEGAGALSNFFASRLSAWPDLYLSVGELNVPDKSFISEQLGGPIFMTIALAGLVSCALQHWRRRPVIPAVLILFALASFMITLGAQRFVLLMVVPMSMGFAFGLDMIIHLFKLCRNKFINKEIWRNAASLLAGCALLGLIALPVLWLKTSIRTLLNPIFNATWEEALLDVREKTPANSIVTGWWPPGHFIKAIAQRAVTFDGASINVPQGYWVARMFLAQSENEALGILRMLNTGGNKAVELFQSIGLDLSMSILAVEDLISRPRHEAMGILAAATQSPQSSAVILEHTHALPPPSYILIYNEFVENNLLLKFVARYNFKAIEALNKNPQALNKIPQHKSGEYIQFLWTLAGGPSKYSGILPLISQNSEQLAFQENVSIHRDAMIAHIDSEKYGKGFAASVFYLKDGVIAEKKLTGGSPLPFSAVLFDNEGTPAVILMDRELAKSLLIQLYFYDGAGFDHIKPFVTHRDLTGRTKIKVFEVDWAGFIEEFDN